MAEYKKPPIGVSPHWHFLRKRIEELNEAIGRYLTHIAENPCASQAKDQYRLIAWWAKEIEGLALLLIELEEKEKDNG